MGARGPAPTPTPVLKARGSWRAELNRNEPRPPPGPPPCPKAFGPAERVVWRAVCKALRDMGLLTKADGGALARYVRFLIRWRACEDHIARFGLTQPVVTTDPDVARIGEWKRPGEHLVGWAEFPQVRESHRLDKALRGIEDRFGLSPSARSRLTVAGDPPAGPKLHRGDDADDERYFFG